MMLLQEFMLHPDDEHLNTLLHDLLDANSESVSRQKSKAPGEKWFKRLKRDKKRAPSKYVLIIYKLQLLISLA